jgi:predicted transcriptional regulator
MTRAGYLQAEPSNLSKGQTFAFAESIAKQLDFKPGDDIHDLVTRIGGEVRVEDTLTEDPERSGSLFVESPNKFTIIVPAHTSRLRDRFTIAHELGHFIVHYMWRRHQGDVVDRPMMALRKGSDRIEWEANWFAAGFLMPAAEFTDAFSRAAGDISVVAETFEVSLSAAQVRASQLGLSK